MKEPWIFENYSNWGRGGCKSFERRSREIAEDMAHEQLRGWYVKVRYYDGKRYYSVAEHGHLDRDHPTETHYFNEMDNLVGKVRRTRMLS